MRGTALTDIRTEVFGADSETRQRSAKKFVERCFPKGVRAKCRRCVFLEELTTEQVIDCFANKSRQHCGFPMELIEVV